MDNRTSYGVIEWANGAFAASFAMNALGIKYSAFICSSGKEVIMGIQKCKLDIEFAGYTVGDQRLLTADLEPTLHNRIPLVVANLTREAPRRQHSVRTPDGLTVIEAAKARSPS